MSNISTSTPKGTRDFLPEQMAKRSYIFDTIKRFFFLYGFEEIETPAIENIETLTGKYGVEGDKLIFKILKSGDFLKDVDRNDADERSPGAYAAKICDKALRYDLTVPFARFVVNHRNDITLPFKRFQIQPVWRADRPQKGRYREFYQCDADVIGSTSLWNEVELIHLIDNVFSTLSLSSFEIRLNNRKILQGIAELVGASDKLIPLTVAIDKLDKIGEQGVLEEINKMELGHEANELISSIIQAKAAGKKPQQVLQDLEQLFRDHDLQIGLQGIEELQYVLNNVDQTTLKNGTLAFDITLARGLDYYTGIIIEVVANNTSIGSICGGGRYDNLTGIFGMPDVSGVGISFGADRIVDVLNEQNLFPDLKHRSLQVLILNFGQPESEYCYPILGDLRSEGISAEIYPDAVKLKKQMKFADQRGVRFVVMAGSQEMEIQDVQVKDMLQGTQVNCKKNDLKTTILQMMQEK